MEETERDKWRSTTENRDIPVEFRNALLEAKESMEGKRKLNTIDNLIDELKEYSKP
jgi:hypothetical protein